MKKRKRVKRAASSDTGSLPRNGDFVRVRPLARPRGDDGSDPPCPPAIKEMAIRTKTPVSDTKLLKRVAASDDSVQSGRQLVKQTGEGQAGLCKEPSDSLEGRCGGCGKFLQRSKYFSCRMPGKMIGT
jgi:hypothetical protein